MAGIDAARAAAWDVMTGFDEGTIDRVADWIDARGLDQRDTALARELSLGVVRHRALYDFIAATFLRPGPQPPELLRTLRLLCHQLFALDRVPAHAAVDASVELLHRAGMSKLAGVANAVARKLVTVRDPERHGDGPLGRIPERMLPGDPAVRHGLPKLLVADLRPYLPGPEDESLAALNRVPHLCTRQRPGKPAPVGASIVRREGPWTWWDDSNEALSGPVAAGHAVVQDRSQGVVLDLTGARPGELVLDLCAAPGGKALALLDRGCRVIAADTAYDRLRTVRNALGGDSRLLVQDGRRPALAAAFDLVVVDAPCSNSGVLARRPEARWRYDEAHLATLDVLQRQLIASGAGLVAPGGRLVYSTCSLSPRENQGVAHRLDGWRLLAERITWPDPWQAGGYAALLVRR